MTQTPLPQPESMEQSSPTLDSKAISVPSGDQTGPVALAPNVSRCSPEPSAPTTYRSCRPSSPPLPEKTSLRPSGDQLGHAPTSSHGWIASCWLARDRPSSVKTESVVGANP